MLVDDLRFDSTSNLNIMTDGIKNVKLVEVPAGKKKHSGPEPIIIPIILKMAEFDHKVC